jgi:tetratricopeptide (TPR) repeat protein
VSKRKEENDKENGLVNKLIELAEDGELSPEKIIELAEKSNAADQYFDRGQTFIRIDRDEALEYFQAAYKLYSEIGNSVGQANALHWLGVTYRAKSKWDKSIEYEQMAYKIYSELDHKRGMGETIHNIGYCYYYLERFEEAKRPFEESIEIHKELGLIIRLRDSLFNLASSYKNLGKYSEAIKHFGTCLKLDLEEGTEDDKARDYQELADCYKEIDNFNSALKHYQQSYELFKKLDYGFRQSEIIENIEIILESLKEEKNLPNELSEQIENAKELIKEKELI